MEPQLLIPLIIFLSVVQSIFGVGLLVFGTPILLLAGTGFEQTLAWLLPCSLTISSLQLLSEWRIVSFKRQNVLGLAFGVLLGLLCAIFVSNSFNLNAVVGILLITTAFLRLNKKAHALVQHQLAKSPVFLISVIGLIHGLTNMGGGLLTIFVSSQTSDKVKTRANIAFGYLVMTMSQLILLSFRKVDVLCVETFFLMALSGATFFFYRSERFFPPLRYSLPKSSDILDFYLWTSVVKSPF